VKRIISAVRDDKRGSLFRVGDRVHWYEYSADMVIMNGGYGIIIEIEKRALAWDGSSIPFLKVMKDGCSLISDFPIHDCDLEENWED